MKYFLTLLSGLTLAVLVSAQDDEMATLREAPLTLEPAAPRMAVELNTDVRVARNYPEQPPLIPHKIEGYPLNLNANKCLACHNRHRVSESGAPMVSVTHFMDRDMQILAEVSPRRYFCLQCHVPQTDATPLVGNSLQDANELINHQQASGQ